MPKLRNHKRALSVWRGKDILVNGDREMAGRLREAIGWASSDHRQRRPVGESLTHNFHAYPARMPPALVRKLLFGEAGVLCDPFCGSGTSIVEGVAAGMTCLASDINPVATLLTRAKSHVGSPAFQKSIESEGRAITRRIQNQARAAKGEGKKKSHQRGRQESVFSPHVFRELTALRAAIEEGKPALRVPLLACLSAISLKVSKKQSDSQSGLEHKSIGRGLPSQLFSSRASDLKLGLRYTAKGEGSARVAMADARALPWASEVVDLIVTSPPYPGTYNYFAHHADRLAILGLDGNHFDAAEVGARRAADAADFAETWEADLGKILQEMARVSKPGASLFIVLGDTAVGDAAWRGPEQVRDCAPKNLEFVASAGQLRKAWGSREKRAFAKKAKREWVIALRRK